MSARTHTKPVIANAIGRRLPTLRGEASTARVAQEARALGLNWRRETVTWIEKGRRGLSIEEVMLLPLVLTAATRRHVRLADLFVEDVQITERLTLKRRAFRELLAGEAVSIPGYTPMGLVEMRKQMKRAEEQWRRAQRGGN